MFACALKVNKKLILKAIHSVLADKYQAGKLTVVENFEANGKTKNIDVIIWTDLISNWKFDIHKALRYYNDADDNKRKIDNTMVSLNGAKKGEATSVAIICAPAGMVANNGWARY